MSLFGTKTIYFIDSENVNENWIDTITDIKKSDEIRVFYTEKSTNASYEHISKIAGGDVTLNLIKCFTGQNALDFQLVTDLGYSVAKGMRDTFVIVSNDKGYDAVVNYWVIKGVNVSRVGVEMESPKKTKLKKRAAAKDKADKPRAVRKVQTVQKTASRTTTKASADRAAGKAANKAETNRSQQAKSSSSRSQTSAKSSSDKVETKRADRTSATPESVWESAPTSDEQYMEAVGRCVSVKELNHYHMVLTNLFGQEKGTEYYHKLKDDKDLKAKIKATYITRKPLRLDYLVRLFLVYNKKDFADLADIIRILNSKKCDSLNSFYRMLTEKFKEDKGRMYYNIFKGIYNVLKEI